MIEEVKLPEISENVESGQVISVMVKVGEFVEKDQSLLELETDKAAFEVPSPLQGRITELSIKAGDTINVGQTIAKIDTAAKPGEQPPSTMKQKPAVSEVSTPLKRTPPAPSAGPVNAAPAVRQLARELGIDINKVPPSASDGHISADDVKNYARSLITGTPSAVSPQVYPGGSARPLPDFSQFGNIERQPMTLTRKSIAAQLGYSWPLVPQVTQHDQTDITDLEEFRAEYGPRVEKAGGKLTVTSILLKVIADALKQFPRFNASYDPQTQELIVKKY